MRIPTAAPLAALCVLLGLGVLASPVARAYDDIGDPDEPGTGDLLDLGELGDPEEPGDLDDDFDPLSDPDESDPDQSGPDNFAAAHTSSSDLSGLYDPDDFSDPDEFSDPDDLSFELAQATVAPPPPEAKPAPAAPSTRSSSLSLTGKTPLADNYALEIVNQDIDSITVELPVLVTESGEDFSGVEFWLVAEVMVDGVKVTETRQWIGPPTVADLAPTVVWLKVAAPIAKPSGRIEYLVYKASTGGELSPLFTRGLDYRL